MIKNTVFVLGAGASCPYGFPSGSELREQIIAHHIDDSSNYLWAKNPSENYVNEILKGAKDFVETFRKSTTKSIDLFLARNKRYRRDGQRAIAFRILAAEKESSFREQSKKRSQDWYTWLFGKMTDEIIKEEDFNSFSENDLSIITFNYDRSLEHFLFDSLRNSFKGIGIGKVIEQLNHIKICHIFNQIAYLEWQNQPNDVKYRTESKNISIIYDEEENPKLQEARDLLSNAQRVFFLGFGYAKENLEALKIPETLANVTSVFGTGLNLTEKDVAIYKSIFQSRGSGGKRIFIKKDSDCLKLLKEWL